MKGFKTLLSDLICKPSNCASEISFEADEDWRDKEQATPEAATLDGRVGAIMKVSIAEKLSHFTDHWNPRVVGELNGQHVKLVKLKGDFVWHHHEHADELFLVLKGRLLIHLRDRDISLDPGEFFIVPKGVEHQPVAEDEVHVLLFEPAGTLNTGNVTNEHTVHDLEKI